MKKIVYAETTEDFTKYIEVMQQCEIYRKYPNFQNHVEIKILPRPEEWSLKDRYNRQLPTHNQNTTNYVEYSFRMTKDVQFEGLGHTI